LSDKELHAPMTPTAPTSIWWRLSDVIPLAEHAMAVPAHRLTGAQVCAGDTIQPALVWTSDPTGDWLASNGVPVWYDHDGTDHQAAACTWYHTASGVRGSPGQPDPAAGFLPLTRRPPHPGRRAHQPTLIDLLRKGARTGCHWFVLDTHPHAAANGTRYRVSDHRDDTVPEHTRWIPATVTCPEIGEAAYPALVADGYTTADSNTAGGLIPRFDHTTVAAMLADLTDRHLDHNPATDPMPGELALLRFDGPTLAVLWEHDDGCHTSVVEIDRVYPDRDGRFALGAFQWTWRIEPTP
jgi:hypothetical protein